MGEGPFEADAEDAAGFGASGVVLSGGAVGRRGVEALEFGEEFFTRGEAVIAGVGIGDGVEGGEFIDGGDAEAAKAGGEGDLTRADEGVIGAVEGLAFFAGAHVGEVMFVEQQHASMVKRGRRDGNEKVGGNG
jgi:hypothetical protein